MKVFEFLIDNILEYSQKHYTGHDVIKDKILVIVNSLTNTVRIADDLYEQIGENEYFWFRTLVPDNKWRYTTKIDHPTYDHGDFYSKQDAIDDARNKNYEEIWVDVGKPILIPTIDACLCLESISSSYHDGFHPDCDFPWISDLFDRQDKIERVLSLAFIQHLLKENLYPDDCIFNNPDHIILNKTKTQTFAEKGN